MKKWPVAAAFAAGALAASAMILGVARSTAASPPSAVREVLATTAPSVARGYTLSLLRTTAPPKTALPKHYHPGTQDVYILQGTTTYTVYKGEARIYHGPADATSKPTQVIKAGQTGTLHAGDWFVETPDLVHSAIVTSKVPLVVLQAGLLKTGQPLAVVVK